MSNEKKTATKSQKPTADKPRKPKSDASETSEKTLAISEQSDMSDSLKTQIIQIVRDEVTTMLESQTIPKLQTESPPLPKEKETNEETGRKRAKGGRTKIAGTLDKELDRLFREWREERGVLTLSRGLDVIFWHFFNKPKMSFEISEDSDK